MPSSLFGQSAPSKKIQIAQIGCGRIARDMDLPGILKHDITRIVAVCDLDLKRVADAKKLVADYYVKKLGSASAVPVKTLTDNRALLQMPGIDAVANSTPDHWHAELVIAAALSATLSAPKAARFRSAASSGPTPNFAPAANWSAMDVSASCTRSRLVCRVTLPVR
ncbi:MAG: hypothetical protein MUF81_05980 [Verrucomicrobia bacterium]|nr:hypothetical protein [Verrucomicrobiota bacterium]